MRIDDNSEKKLAGYEWPGNVRQLENTIERAVALEAGEVLHVELPIEKSKSNGTANGAISHSQNGDGFHLPAEGVDMERHIASLERQMLQTALEQSKGVQTRAAEMLKLSYRSFRHLMKKYDI